MTVSQISIILIYTKIYLNARSYLIKEKDFQEHACCKIEMDHKTSLYILGLYRSPNSSSENKKLLSQLFLSSLIGENLMILKNFNFSNINWDDLLIPHLSIIVLRNSLQQHKMPSYSNTFRALYILGLIKNQL